MIFCARLNIWILTLGFILTTVYNFKSNAQNDPIQSSHKFGNECSGELADLNCYKDIIRKQAHRLNVQEGFVPPTQEDFRSGEIKKATYQGQMIMIDIQDREACNQVKSYLESGNLQQSRKSVNLGNLCDLDPKEPNERYRSITVMWETREEFITPLNFLTSTEKNLVTDTRNLSVMMMATLGLFWVSPESISNWDKEKIRKEGFFKSWNDNTKSKPVRDRDGKFLNFVAHPYAGAAYYNIARSNGLSRIQSLGYSVLMSTFLWEYGFEALVEKPSIQDLIITPLLGSIIGEVFYQWAQKIKNSDGRVFGSRTVGSLLLFLLNPTEKLSDGINKILGSRVIQSAQSQLVLGRKRDTINPRNNGNYIGIQLKFEF